MRNRFSCLVASLSVSLVLSSGCTPWGTLQFNRAAAQREDDEAKTDTSHRPFQDTQNEDFAIDNKIGDRDRPLDEHDFGNGQRNETSNNNFLLGRRAEDVGELESARKFYQNVLLKHPTHAHAHHRLGVVADKMQHFAKAERHYKSALNYMSPDNRQEISIVFSDLGYSYLLRGDFPQSERALNNALAYHEDSRIAIRNLALLHGYRGDFEKAYQRFASVGGEAEARAELDRLFPHWQDNAGAGQNEQTIAPSSPALAANDIPPRMATDSSTFPTSHVRQSRQFPQQSSRTATPIISSKTSQHLAFNTEPTINPESTNGPRPQSPSSERMTAMATAPRQPLQAPPPHEYLADNIPGAYAAPPVQPSTTEQHARPAAAQITQAGYTAAAQPHQRQQTVTTTPIHNPGRPTPHIAIQIDNIQSKPTNPASRTALAIGGAVGLGGMFPTSQLEPSQPIQQMSAEAPNSMRSHHNPPPQMPSNATPPYSPPANAPTGLIRSPNSTLDRTEPIPSPNVTNYRVAPIGNNHQQTHPPVGSIPSSFSTPKIPHVHSPAH